MTGCLFIEMPVGTLNCSLKYETQHKMMGSINYNDNYSLILSLSIQITMKGRKLYCWSHRFNGIFFEIFGDHGYLLLDTRRDKNKVFIWHIIIINFFDFLENENN